MRAATHQPKPRAPASPVTPNAPSRWTGGRIAMIVAGGLLALIAVGALASGAYGLWLDSTQRTNGYVMTSSERFATGSYALATRTLNISSDMPSFLYGRDWLGSVRIRGKSTNANRPLFIGIARKADVDRYLAGVAHSDVVDVNASPFGTTYRPSYRAQPGGKPPTPPERADIWVARVTGSGNQTLMWSAKHGQWAAVVMRPDGSPGVSADLAAGARLPALLWASIGLVVLGLLTLSAAAALITFGARSQPAPKVPVLGALPFVMVIVALGAAAAAAPRAQSEQRSFGLGLRGVSAAQAPGCVPVPAAECGSVRVPLFWSEPAGPTIEVAYVLVRHRDPALPSARGTVAFNPGGPGGGVIDSAAMWTGLFSDLLTDHDLLLIDPRGTGRVASTGLWDCGVSPDPGRVHSGGRALQAPARSAGACVHLSGHGR